MDSSNDNKSSLKLTMTSNDIAGIYKQALSDQNINYLDGYLSMYQQTLSILNENLELKNVSFISLINKLRDKITQTKTEFSANLNEPIYCNRNIVNLNGMKIKENKKRVYDDVTDFRKISFEEEKASSDSNINNDNIVQNSFFTPSYKKIKDV